MPCLHDFAVRAQRGLCFARRNLHIGFRRHKAGVSDVRDAPDSGEFGAAIRGMRTRTRMRIRVNSAGAKKRTFVPDRT